MQYGTARHCDRTCSPRQHLCTKPTVKKLQISLLQRRATLLDFPQKKNGCSYNGFNGWLTFFHIPLAVPDQRLDVRVVPNDAHLRPSRSVVLHYSKALAFHHHLRYQKQADRSLRLTLYAGMHIYNALPSALPSGCGWLQIRGVS